MGKEDLFSKINSLFSGKICFEAPSYNSDRLNHEKHNEYHSYCNYLEENGFTIKHGIAGMKTAVCAEYQSLGGGPIIGMLTQYRALSDDRFGMQTSSIHVATAIAIKEELGGKYPFQLVLFFAQDEENHRNFDMGDLLRSDYFKKLDVLLAIQGGSDSREMSQDLVVRTYKVEFRGKQAHAAAHPWDGRSAFDGLQMAFHGVEFMRKHFPNVIQISYTLTDSGGTPVNVVSDYAAADFQISSAESAGWEDVCRQFEQLLSGAALMTGTEVVFNVCTEYEDITSAQPITKHFDEGIFLNKMNRDGLYKIRTTFVDFNDIRKSMPCFCIKLCLIHKNVDAHSGSQCKSEEKKKVDQISACSAKMIADMECDLIMEPELLRAIQTRWLKGKDVSDSL